MVGMRVHVGMSRRARGGAAAWDPASISGLRADLSADTARTTTGTDYAAEFAAAGTDYLQAADAARLRPSPAVGYTVVMWVRNGGTTTGLANRENSWRLDNGAGGARYIQWHSGGINTVDLAGNLPGAGEWAMLAFGADVAGGVIFARRDRTTRRTSSLGGTPTAGTANLQVGTSATGGLVGRVGHFGIWQRPLTDAELDTLFLNGCNGLGYAALAGTLADVSEWWDFTEASGNCVGAVGGTALVRTGTVVRAAGPAALPATTTGSTIERWLSGGTAATADVTAVAAARPTYLASTDSPTGRSAVRFPLTTTNAMSTVFSADIRGHTIAYVSRARQRDSAHDHVSIGTSGSGIFVTLRDFSQGRITAETASGSIGGAAAVPAIQSRSRGADVRVWTSGTGGVSLAIDGTTPLTGATLSAGTASGLTVGSTGSYTSFEDFERVLIWNRELTAGEVATVKAQLAALYPLQALSGSSPVVLATGNSIHFGVGCDSTLTDILGLATAALGLPMDGSRWRDLSFPAQVTTQCTADDPAKLAVFRNDARLTVVCWTEITNDIYLAGSSAAVAYQNVKDYVAAVKTALPTNSKIVLTTCLPRGVSYTTRNAVNASLRAAFPTTTAYSMVFLPTDAAFTNCVLADWAADPTMGPDGAQNSATYYDSFNIHPTTAGAAILAVITANALRAAGV